MKLGLAFAAVLLFAGSAHAQRIIGNAGGSGANYSMGATAFGSGGAWTGINSPIGRPVLYEAPREFAISYATNDGPFVPSVYMDYQEALELGRKELAEAEAQAKN